MVFKLVSPYKPAGDQSKAIEKLACGIRKGVKDQVLLGVTGSGKTFTIANVIKNVNLPTLVISHNKTLTAQLFQEFREFFPENAVEYFVSYYDYYQPESYIPQTDTYIEKDASINEEIDKLRLSTTTSLLTRKDVIVTASVSCIYNIGSPVDYAKTTLELRTGMHARHTDVQRRLVQLLYERSDFEPKRGTFRIRGGNIDIFPAYADFGIEIEILGNRVSNIFYFDIVSGKRIEGAGKSSVIIYPAKQYITSEGKREFALKEIEKDLYKRVKELNAQNKKLEAYRLEQRTKYDLEMLSEIGYCKGIENYSVYFDGRNPGDKPYTLLDFFNYRFGDDWLLVVDESHMTIPQVRGMYNGDRSRKETLVEYGFRLPTALDNRPLKFDEFLDSTSYTIYSSATPAKWELDRAGKNGVVEQLVRPTGLLDPEITVLPTKNQIEDLVARIEEKVKHDERVLVTTLTKKMAEELSDYLLDRKIKVTYLHSDIETLERTDILNSLREGEYDVLVGINLLREGLDLPEVSLVAILDADKEGFLRSETSLIQTMGRAARHVKGEVIMYADNITDSMKRAIKEVKRRRKIQEEFNRKYNIIPKSIKKPLRERLIEQDPVEENKTTSDLFIKDYEFRTLNKKEQRRIIRGLEKRMKELAEVLEFEKAAKIRDRILALKSTLL